MKEVRGASRQYIYIYDIIYIYIQDTPVLQDRFRHFGNSLDTSGSVFNRRGYIGSGFRGLGLGSTALRNDRGYIVDRT